MKVELIGALDYDKVEKLLSQGSIDEEKKEYILENLKQIEKSRHSELVSTAGRLSRFDGDIDEVLHLSELKKEETNIKYAKTIVDMGHRSIIDHDYLVFKLKNVSAIVEQMIIAERYASFTIKSRREADFSRVGYYIPDFHDKNGKILNNNQNLKDIYIENMQYLFDSYRKLNEMGIDKEDSRFLLPYSYNSNIMMGIDAHTLLDMIIKYTKTKYSKVSELKEFGEKLYNVAKEYTPYLIPIIDKIPVNYEDPVDAYLENSISRENYDIVDKVKLTNTILDIDEQIIVSAIMKRYQYDYDRAKKVYYKLKENAPNFSYEIMKKIALEGNKEELTAANFYFQIPVSYAILTHLTRHRTHKILVPDFYPNVDLSKYKIPPKIKSNNETLSFYETVIQKNKDNQETLRNYKVREEDLIYYILSGTMTNVITNMDAWTVRHILELRECNKAQWETRQIAHEIHDIIKTLPDAKAFESILGPTCETMGICRERKEHCGKKLNLKKEEIKVL